MKMSKMFIVVLIYAVFFISCSKQEAVEVLNPQDITDADIISTDPKNGETGVGFTKSVSIQFADHVSDDAISALEVRMTRANGVVEIAGTTAFDTSLKTLTFTPNFPYVANDQYDFELVANAASATTIKEVAPSDGAFFGIDFVTDSRPVLFRSNQDPDDPTLITHWNIWSMNADGTEKTQLTNHSDVDSSWGFFGNSWSPGYEYISYQTYDSERNVRGLWIMNADGSGQINITTGSSGARVEEAVWSPDGSKLYYIYRVDGESVYNLYLTTPEGYLHPITEYSGENSITEMMRISPDGNRMLYRLRNTSTDRNSLYVIELNTPENEIHELTSYDESTSIFQTKYSSDGSKIYYLAGDTGTGNRTKLYMINLNADGTAVEGDPVLMTSYPDEHQISSFSLSPDDSRIVYADYIPLTGLTDFYVMNSDGSSVERFNSLESQASAEFIWSPDGTKLAYGIGNLATTFDLFITTSADLATMFYITEFTGNIQYITGQWSTDGTQFMYHFYNSDIGHSGISIANADDSGITALTDPSTENSVLLDWWQPVVEAVE